MDLPSENLAAIYRRRFENTSDYRNQVWSVLTQFFFNRLIPAQATVLDLGCGYGEFINQIRAARKIAMDLNPDVPKHLHPEIQHLCQDCSAEWPLSPGALDVVFTSNFFEHLADKEHLLRTLRQVWRCLKPGGSLIAIGPNIKHLAGKDWDVFDHHVMLTEASLGEALAISGFELQQVVERFLPFTMVNARRYPLWVVRVYLATPVLWRIFGRQFLVVARKPSAGSPL